jgi:hypothetical protein
MQTYVQQNILKNEVMGILIGIEILRSLTMSQEEQQHQVEIFMLINQSMNRMLIGC